MNTNKARKGSVPVVQGFSTQKSIPVRQSPPKQPTQHRSMFERGVVVANNQHVQREGKSNYVTGKL